MPSPDRTTGDRVVRGGATSRTVVRELSARGLQHGIDPAATEGPEAVGDAGGLRRLIPQAVGNSEIFNARCAENRGKGIPAEGFRLRAGECSGLPAPVSPPRAHVMRGHG